MRFWWTDIFGSQLSCKLFYLADLDGPADSNRLIIIPLSYLRRLDSLKYTSIAALVCIGYLVVLVVYHFFKGDTMADRGPIRVIHWAGAVPTLSSLPVTIFAFTCHQNVRKLTPFCSSAG